MDFEITLTAPTAHGSKQYESTSTVVPAKEVAEHLRRLGLNWYQSDQWSAGKVFIVIEPVKPDAEAQVRELQDKLDSIRVVVED